MKWFKFVLIPLFLCAWLLQDAQGQQLEGQIKGDKEEILIGATLHWLGTSVHTVSDQAGHFQISTVNITDFRLVLSYIGYQNDTLQIDPSQQHLDITMTSGETLETVEVAAKKQGSYVSSLNAIKTEVISEVELSKAACCDLAGCFGTEASVQANTTNIVTNAKELRILGLSGVYNQVLIDGMPLIQGLSYTYGISAIPGTLVKNIFVAKGANSVLQGYESMVGQINVVLKDPADSERLLANVYLNSFLEKQFNLQYSHQFKDWSSLLAIHSTQPADRIDQDDDRFIDLPLLRRYSVYNKWQKGNEAEWGFHSKIAWSYLDEHRVGGQVDFDPKIHEGKNQVYGQTVDIRQPSVYTKTGFRMDDVHHFDLIVSAYFQDQKAYYGLTRYRGKQLNAYANLQYERTWKEVHNLKTGFSYRYQRLEENIGFNDDLLNRTYDGLYLKKESIPGVFAENTFNWLNRKLVLITGLRVDHHQEFGWQWTPRALVKYQLGEQTTMRASIGRGWRTANIFSENVNLLASSRNVLFTEALRPEETLNYGFNIIQKWVQADYEAWFSLDLYRTRFYNQIFPDYDRSQNEAIISNFTGTSVGNGLKVEINLDFWQIFNTKFAYNYLDVYRKVETEKVQLPFIPKHKLLGVFSFQPRSKAWHFDVNIHWFGRQRLARTNNNPPEFQLPASSNPYWMFNAQFTKSWKQLDLYAGCENIFNFRQERAILSWQNPFGAYFDTASVWGPTRGREFYFGVRYKIL